MDNGLRVALLEATAWYERPVTTALVTWLPVGNVPVCCFKEPVVLGTRIPGW